MFRWQAIASSSDCETGGHFADIIFWTLLRSRCTQMIAKKMIRCNVFVSHFYHSGVFIIA